jgi:ABC-type Fe3+-hydroxamate transport system substrate-binding protein
VETTSPQVDPKESETQAKKIASAKLNCSTLQKFFILLITCRFFMIINPQHIIGPRIYSRIVSLVPSQTELLYDLGLEDEVKAITKFCVHPAKWYKNKTRIGGTKNVNINAIKKINPDLIIANKEENVKEQVEELAKTFDVLVTDVNNFQEALQMIKDIGVLTGKITEALTIVNKIESKFQNFFGSTINERKIKTAYLIWENPFMAAGRNTFINDMMQYCGLENIFSKQERYPKITLEDLQNCELVLLSSEPYPFKEKHLKEMQAQIPGLKIIIVDGEMFSWYGSRLLKAADYFEKLQKNKVLLY